MLKCSYKIYFNVSLVVTISLLLSVATINYMIDPYGKMGNNRIGLFHSLDREIKNQIVFFDHDAILIGSSKTGFVNPDDLHFYSFYNASFDAAMPEEIFFYIKKYATHQKFVLIGLDFSMFNGSVYPVKPMTEWNRKTYTTIEYLLGGRVLLDSKKNVSLWLKNKPFYIIKKNGQKVVGKSSPDFRDNKKTQKILDFLETRVYGNMRFSDKRMEYLKRMKALLENRNIDYLVFINPLSEEVYDIIKNSGSYTIFMAWKKKLKVIFPNLVDLSYGQYSDEDKFTGSDPFHYKPETGASFLNKILSGARATHSL